MRKQMQGTIVHISPKGFGFIQTRDGNNLLNYYFHTSRIVLCECEIKNIAVGMFAKFAVSPIPPKRPDGAPYATNVEIYFRDPSIDAASSALAGKVTR